MAVSACLVFTFICIVIHLNKEAEGCFYPHNDKEARPNCFPMQGDVCVGIASSDPFGAAAVCNVPWDSLPCDMLAGQVSSAYKEYGWSTSGGGRAHYVMVCVSKMQWKPFWLATQLDPQNDWTGWQTGVNDDTLSPSQGLLQSAIPHRSKVNSDRPRKWPVWEIFELLGKLLPSLALSVRNDRNWWTSFYFFLYFWWSSAWRNACRLQKCSSSDCMVNVKLLWDKIIKTFT